ncbi:hypothetical protein [Agitococcus lubricus]|uniref:Lipoprotein n=1 Tax=Agitococcus lubricus TaxID=1077255 RepID=A0A2T5IZQ4_9GAMM|nr:hypothetical protein [Agitococcus lubricus]PTQ89479.1 hypothetical protein C8N29_10610 [Agitococcus lubricus]
MAFNNKLIFNISLLFLLTSCGYLFQHQQDWSFIQSVGGVKISNPVYTDAGLILPVFCDVSGLYGFTVKPTVMNSALVFVNVNAKVKEGEINIMISTKLASSNTEKDRTRCQPVHFKSLPIGSYKVYYKDLSGVQNYIDDVVVGK